MKKWGLVFLGIAVALLTLEILVRIFFDYEAYDPHVIQSQSINYVRNSITGVLPAPNQEIQISNLWNSGFDAHYRINSFSYRGDDFEFSKAETSTRVLVLGGSSAFDLVSLDNQDWPHLVQSKLERLGGNSSIQVINGAVPGYASYNAFARLSSESWLLEPDYVLIYECWNDLKYFPDVSDEQSLLQSKALDMQLLWSEYQNNHYINPLDEFLGFSHLYLRLRRGLVPTFLTDEATVNEGDLQNSYSPLAVEQYSINLKNIVDFSRRIGAEPVFVLQARLVHESNTEAEKRRIAYHFVGLGHEALLKAFGDCDLAMREIAEEEGLLLIDGTASMNGNPELFVDHVHTTPMGSEMLAETVAEALDTRLNAR